MDMEKAKTICKEHGGGILADGVENMEHLRARNQLTDYELLAYLTFTCANDGE